MGGFTTVPQRRVRPPQVQSALAPITAVWSARHDTVTGASPLLAAPRGRRRNHVAHHGWTTFTARGPLTIAGGADAAHGHP